MASGAGLAAFCQKVWEPVLAKSRRAVVFVDEPCAEILHWCGGAELFLAAGALNVKEFSSFESGGPGEPKAVFVVSSPVRGRALAVLRDVVSQSSFQYCIVVTAVSPGEAEGRMVYEQLEEKLCEWMGNLGYTAEVLWAPLMLAPLSPWLLVAPAFHALCPLLPGQDLQTLNRSRPDKKRFPGLGDVDFPSLPPGLQAHIRSLVSGLSNLMEGIGVREECFSVGWVSQQGHCRRTGQPPPGEKPQEGSPEQGVTGLHRPDTGHYWYEDLLTTLFTRDVARGFQT
ncbi:unnamed protein product [Ranitomeya imitator]|uniref:Sec1 family domain containing 2 n=1 Tax=Ranitomeya imitator TaxID=111125 RepID=A0ABN9L906_9NEOB|nr:unnamed protein product [Ranitomeya imitator]